MRGPELSMLCQNFPTHCSLEVTK